MVVDPLHCPVASSAAPHTAPPNPSRSDDGSRQSPNVPVAHGSVHNACVVVVDVVAVVEVTVVLSEHVNNPGRQVPSSCAKN